MIVDLVGQKKDRNSLKYIITVAIVDYLMVNSDNLTYHMRVRMIDDKLILIFEFYPNLRPFL